MLLQLAWAFAFPFPGTKGRVAPAAPSFVADAVLGGRFFFRSTLSFLSSGYTEPAQDVLDEAGPSSHP